MENLGSWLFGILAAIVPGLGEAQGTRYNGYAEIDYVYVAPVTGGRITDIFVKEGDAVAAGDLLVTFDTNQYKALLAAAEAQVAAAEAALRNLETGGRDDEIAAARASLAQAEADLQLARDTAARSERLFEEGVVTQARRDQDRTGVQVAEAQVAQLAAQLKVIELPARDAQQQQAEANLAAAKANADKARLDLDDRQIKAPADGRVEQLFYSVGEIDAAGGPLLSLDPQGALKVRFFVPEAERSALRLGQSFAVSCDGCPAGLVATLSYMSSDPQFTPPVIYSRDERQRLSFLAEATLPDGALHPGQPITVEPLP